MLVPVACLLIHDWQNHVDGIKGTLEDVGKQRLFWGGCTPFPDMAKGLRVASFISLMPSSV